MPLKSILNHVETQKGFIDTDARFSDDPSQILVALKPPARSTLEGATVGCAVARCCSTRHRSKRGAPWDHQTQENVDRVRRLYHLVHQRLKVGHTRRQLRILIGDRVESCLHRSLGAGTIRIVAFTILAKRCPRRAVDIFFAATKYRELPQGIHRCPQSASPIGMGRNPRSRQPSQLVSHPRDDAVGWGVNPVPPNHALLRCFFNTTALLCSSSLAA